MALNDFYYENSKHGYKITGLKSKALFDIVIPEGTASIEERAFYESNIRSVHFPKSLLTIEKEAFYGCENLTRIEFDRDCDLLSIAWGAFSYTSIEKLTLPSVNYIGYCAFNSCYSLTEVKIPKTVCLLDAFVFGCCDYLEKIIIEGDKIPSSWDEDWCGCLAKVEFTSKLTPSSTDTTSKSSYSPVKEVKEKPAKTSTPKPSTTSKSSVKPMPVVKPTPVTKPTPVAKATPRVVEPQKSITPPAKSDAYAKYRLTNENQIRCVYGDEAVLDMFVTEPYKYGEGVTLVCIKDFRVGFLEIKLPSCVAMLKSKLFKQQSLLTRVICNDELQLIDMGAFYKCYSLCDIQLSKSTAISSDAFESCEALTRARIGKNVYSGAFAYCSGLREVEIDSDIDTIPSRIFTSCHNLKSIYLPDNIKYISSYAFSYCSNLKDIRFSDNITYIEQGAFRGCRGLTHLTLPKNLTWLMEGAFHGCDRLESITFNERLTHIPTKTFLCCDSIRTLRIPATIKRIDKEAFSSLALEEVIIEKHYGDDPHSFPKGWDGEWLSRSPYQTVKIRFEFI